jgi:hypothetical protein
MPAIGDADTARSAEKVLREKRKSSAALQMYVLRWGNCPEKRLYMSAARLILSELDYGGQCILQGGPFPRKTLQPPPQSVSGSLFANTPLSEAGAAPPVTTAAAVKRRELSGIRSSQSDCLCRLSAVTMFVWWRVW